MRGDSYTLQVTACARGIEPGLDRMTLRVEALTETFAATLGGRSASLTLEARCAERRARLISIDVFAAPDLVSLTSSRVTPGAWLADAPGTYLHDVLSAVCPTAPPPRGGGVWAVQLSSSPSLAEAQASRTAVTDQALRLAGQAPRIETARVGGRLMYRVAVPGFSDSAAALAACARLEQAGATCFVRRDGGGRAG